MTILDSIERPVGTADTITHVQAQKTNPRIKYRETD